MPTVPNYPTTLSGWQEYHALCLKRMAKVTRSWIRRGVIRTVAQVKIRPPKSLQDDPAKRTKGRHV